MIKPHPRRIDDLLLRHAAGALDAGQSLLVETYLDLSPAERRLHAQFEAIGGLLLDAIEPSPADPSALDRALRALDSGEPLLGASPRRTPKHPKMPEGFALPGPLAEADILPWRWIAPGVRSARVALPKGSASRAFLLEIGPGIKIPRHGHDGEETTCVLRGGFRDGETHFGAGEIAHVDETVEHDIVIDPGSPCLCLIAMEGRTRPSTLFGRLYQKFRDI